MAYNTYNEEELRHLKKLATQGYDEAKDMLMEEGRRLIKAANSRLLRLERSGNDKLSEAYDIAQVFTEDKFNSNRFRINKSMSIDDIVDTMRKARSFMSSETSTGRGIGYAKERLFETLSAYGINVDKNLQDDFFALIRTDAVQDYISFVGDYDLVFDLIAENLKNSRVSFKTLEYQFNQALAGHEAYDIFMEKLAKQGGVDINEMYRRHRDRYNDIYRRRNRRR